jgi:hypothetical protein
MLKVSAFGLDLACLPPGLKLVFLWHGRWHPVRLSLLGFYSQFLILPPVTSSVSDRAPGIGPSFLALVDFGLAAHVSLVRSGGQPVLERFLGSASNQITPDFS